MAKFREDQAAGLRRLLGRRQARVVTFVAGCIGVGKSVLVANLAASLARQGRQVLVVDENTDDGIAAYYGAFVANDLQHVINREKSLSEVVLSLAPGIRVVSAATLVRQLATLGHAEQCILRDCFREIGQPVDIVLVDASLDHPLGFSPLGLAAQEAVIVVSPGMQAITEAYALIKKVSLGYSRRHFRLLVNRARAAAEARAIHENMEQVTRSRRIARLDYAGYVPFDDHLRQACRLCQPVASLFPESPAAKACHRVASEVLNWPADDDVVGGLEHFVQQLLHLSHRTDPAAIYA